MADLSTSLLLVNAGYELSGKLRVIPMSHGQRVHPEGELVIRLDVNIIHTYFADQGIYPVRLIMSPLSRALPAS